MAAEPRYRVDVWADKWLVVDCSRLPTAYRSVMAECVREADANIIVAALNAAEDAGRWKAALEEIAEDDVWPETPYRCGCRDSADTVTLPCPQHGPVHVARQALKAETKEETT